MATRALVDKQPTWVKDLTDGAGAVSILHPYGVRVSEATGLLNTDDTSVFTAPHLSDRTIEVLGTFGAGGTIVVEGRNATSGTFQSAQGLDGNPVSITAAGSAYIVSNFLEIRARVSAGDVNTNLTARFFASTSR